MNILAIENLHVSFNTDNGRLPALRDVTFDIPANTIVGIVGESGCGKSTLINAILGLLADNGQLERGSIQFDGNELSTLPEARLRDLRGTRISTVFQDPMGSLNPVLSIGRQMLDIQYRSESGRREKLALAADMLRQVRIPDPKSALSLFPHQLSGGMKQRVAIAMALLMKPALLIADEPTTALDATLEVAIIELLKELQQTIGCSVLFVSHHLGVIAELCDSVVVMYAGEVVERGPVRQIFHNPGHPYTQQLLACDPARNSHAQGNHSQNNHSQNNHTQGTGKFATIPGDLPDLRQLANECIFINRCNQNTDICHSAPPWKTHGEAQVVRCFKAGQP